MMLRRRAIATSLIAALPAAALLGYLIDRKRDRDLHTTLERVVRSQVNDHVREKCEADPGWFFTGPQIGRPKGGLFVPASEDELAPRPKPSPQPFELFAYDEQFVATSIAGARFPNEFRRALRAGSTPVHGTYDSPAGKGAEVGVATGWTGSVCSFFLGRMEPPPNQLRTSLLTYAGLFVAAFLVAWASSFETVARVRKLASTARESVDAGFTAIAPDTKKDELSSLTFVFNDVATEMHQRKARIEDQDAALRRFVQSTDEDVSKPLAALEATLGAAVTGPAPTREDLHAALRQAHDLSGEVENLTAAARLKMLGQTPSTSRFDLNALVTRIIARHMPVAVASGVGLHLSLPPSTVIVTGDELLIERAIANVVDNAIRYNRTGGEVSVTLSLAEQGQRFRLWIADNGRGVTEEEFRGLTAVRRFRGDEGRSRRPGAPGLGISVSREVSDRFGLSFDLKRPGSGGFEVEFSGPA